jgi:hypothetical protein
VEDLAGPDLETAITRMGALLLDSEAAKAAFGSQQWPGWYSDTQMASEYAQKLARELGAAVNANLIAQRWLDMHGLVPRHRRGVPRRKRRKKRRRARAQAAQQPPQMTTRPAPRQYLNAAGATAAIYAVLLAVLAALWAAAFALGWASALAVAGIAAADGMERALEDLIAAGDQRLRWIILQTRMRRLEQVLLQALREGWSADRLAKAIMDILGSLASALLVTITETTWAQNWAAYAIYKAAGVRYKHWKSRRDGLTCKRCLHNDNLGPVPIDYLYPGGVLFPPIHPRERCVITPAQAPAQQGGSPP